MDLGIGGISGSLLDAPSFLDVFCDDNRGGFTLNWGIDTSTPNIPVAYNNLDGIPVFERRSYNAIVEALTGRIYVRDGVEQQSWTDPDDLINAYLDMSGEVLDESSDGTELAGYVLGDTLENIAEEEEFDSLEAFIVVTEGGNNFLFVVSKEGNDYKLYNQAALFTTAAEAIQDDLSSYGAYVLGVATGPLTDAEIAANAYIAANYGYLTLAEVAEDFDTPVAYTEVWAITWSKGASSGADGYVLLHIGDYFIAVGWL
ncbi:MAG: hypothetical protein MZU79_01445 [Anaerotruncus sp.]|nr:hypothetical protein [Anaerotruncus sp.]